MGASLYSNQDDSTDTHSRTVTRLSLRMKVIDFAGKRTVFKFRGSARRASGSDFSRNIPDSRVTVAKVEWKNTPNKMHVAIGRDYIGELSGARVDGANVKLNLTRHLGVGAFGGLLPDNISENSTSDTTYGGYAFYNASSVGLTGGYVGIQNSSYGYLSGYLYPRREISLYGSTRVDQDENSGLYKITNMLFSAGFRMGKIGRFGASYNEYRAIKFQDGTIGYDANYEVQKAARLTYEFDPFERLRIFGKMEGRTRTSDNSDAALFEFGMRLREIYKWYFAQVRYQDINHFDSKINRTVIEGGISKNAMEAGLALTIATNEGKFSENDFFQLIYGAWIDWNLTHKLFVSGRVEMSAEKYLDTDAIYNEKANSEFKSTTIYLQAGYKF